MTLMTGLLRLPGKTTNWIDDRMNPIVVKELRQAVKSRFVVSVMMLMLVLLMIILASVLLMQDGRRGIDEDAGSDLFLVFQSILLATCMLFVPVYVGVRLAAERSSATSDLIYVTTIRPSSIIWGKLLAGMVVTALIFSACAPFMVITYMLRGIDLPTILFILGLDVLIVLAATQLAIFLGTMPIGWPVKAFLGLVLLGVSIMGYSGMHVLVQDELLRMGIGSAMDDPDFWVSMGVSIGLWLAALGMIFCLSVSMIAPATANRALMPRVYFTLLWIASFIGFSVMMMTVEALEPMVAWLTVMHVMLMITAVICASEREVLGPRIRRSIPRKWPLRIPAFFFYSGAAGGLLWVQGMIVLTLLSAWFARDYYLNDMSSTGFMMYDGYDPFPEAWLPRFAASSMWVLGYLLLAVILCRRATRMKNGTLITGAAGLIIMAGACVLPILIAFTFDSENWDSNVRFWLMFNPFGPLFCEDRDWSGDYGKYTLPLSVAFLAVLQLVNLPWYYRQIRDFKPPADTPTGDGSRDAMPNSAPELTAAPEAEAGPAEPGDG